MCILGLLFFSACCRSHGDAEVDKLNGKSYAFHYRNLDSVDVYARKALSASADYPSGKAEAYNNLAFACIAKMDYRQAYALLDSVEHVTDNQVELLIADVLYMRLCQRESRNKEFYDYRERALRRIKRINEDLDGLSERLDKRYLYAKTEFSIVSSTYYYYVGLLKSSVEAIDVIDPDGGIKKDTAQYLNYLYQLGSGGIIEEISRQATLQKEFELLLECNILAKKSGMVYWQANSLQAISEHLLDKEGCSRLLADNRPAFDYLNSDNMPDSLLAGYLAQKSLALFLSYGDVYQTAGAYRTLSFCYWSLGDYNSSLICLENALHHNKAIAKAPDLVASVRESLSLVYSAMGDKNNSDINRNLYLDIQEETRQDRQLEARAEQLERTSAQLNVLIISIMTLIVAVVVLLLVLNKIRKRKGGTGYIERLLEPLEEWKVANEARMDALNEAYDEAKEQFSIGRLQHEKYKRRSLDSKAKVFLVNNVTPYIDRIINEVERLKSGVDSEVVRNERLVYAAELVDKINEYNDVLTDWIQLRQGRLSLRIESFNLAETFCVLSKSAMSFRLKGLKFNVHPVDAMVKADKILTMFMLNTLADNARKFTPRGGEVTVYATKERDYVEISVKDTGVGLSAEQISTIFDHKIYNGHGFGLMNCKGIIDKYRKISHIFKVCGLFVESTKGKGSRFYFRLPCGFARLVLTFVLGVCSYLQVNAGDLGQSFLAKAGMFADSAYYCNVEGRYVKTLFFADSAIYYLNRHYKEQCPTGKVLMAGVGGEFGVPAEIRWFHDRVKTDYDIILDLRNECAVAALALHNWDVYAYNNDVYTRLFKEYSADKGLEEYCATMQDSRVNKVIAVVVLVVLLCMIVCAYYFLYYRHVLFYRYCVDNIKRINEKLLSNLSDEDKLTFIDNVDFSKFPVELNKVVGKIRLALQRSVVEGRSKSVGIELVDDERRRIEYETERLYVSNNIIDNCLSTLKHETMYYPSRIRHLIENASENIEAVSEVVIYYKTLYLILCEQVNRQAVGIKFECKPVDMAELSLGNFHVFGDKELIAYLFDILEKECGCFRSDISAVSVDEKYIEFKVPCHGSYFVDSEDVDLFAPSVKNIPFLICRQIVREIVGISNFHGCGIRVSRNVEGRYVLSITLAKAVVVSDYK